MLENGTTQVICTCKLSRDGKDDRKDIFLKYFKKN